MELSKRLGEIAKFVHKGAHVADIGTDHAYLPIYLIKNEIANKVIAMDINQGPLTIANRNIKSHGYKENIETRLSNGLDKLTVEDDIDTVTVAGMGGYLVSDILEGSKHVLDTIKYLILQPQSDYDVVRKKIHDLGFKITNETMLRDAQKDYFVISCEKGDESYSSNIYYKYGKILMESREPAYLDYIKRLINQKTNVLQHLTEAGITDGRFNEINEEINELEGILNGNS